MFRQKKTGSKKNGKKANGTAPLRSEKLKFILGIVLLLISVYILISFISYLFYGATDQSKLGINWLELVKDREINVENKGGKTGAFLSEMFINKGFV